MDESDFEGTIVLEKLASIGRVDDFFHAVDTENIQRAIALMKNAGVDQPTIDIVVKKIENGDEA